MTKTLDILIISQFFYPEMGAPAARFHDFGRLLVERGHRVTVITGFPNSPSGIIPAEYRGKLHQEELIDEIRVLRSWIYASPRLTKATKSLGFASFALSSSLQAMFRQLNPDVVVATSPPPTAAIGGMIAAKRFRAPLIFDVRDIWPEAIVYSGRLKSPLLVRGLEKIETTLYENATKVTVVTEGKRIRLMEKAVPEGKLSVIPNGVDLSRFENLEPEKTLLTSFGVPHNRFTIMYAGIFNPAQGLDVLLDAALNLRNRLSNAAESIHFALIGDGARKRHLLERCRHESLQEMFTFIPIQPRDKIPTLLCSADAIVVPLAPRRDTHTVPSKIYESMASGKPVLISADGAPANIIQEAKGGLATPAGDAEKLANSIQALSSNPALCSELGSAGRNYARHSDRRQIVLDFETTLYDAIKDFKR